MTIPHHKIKAIINPIFLVITCGLVVWFMTTLTTDPVLKIVLMIVGAAVDIGAQYILSYGKALWKTGDNRRIGAGILFFLFFIYMVAFAALAAIGFTSSQVDLQEKVIHNQEYDKEIIKNRITQIGRQIDALNLQLKAEAETGYGRRSENIVKETKRLSEEQSQLNEQLKEVKSETKGTSESPFQSLKNIFNVPEGLFKVIIIGLAIVILYICLILTSWDIQLEDKQVYKSESRMETGGSSLQKVTSQGPSAEDGNEPINEEKMDLLKFVDALFEDGEKKLRSNTKIADRTGWPLSKCIRFRTIINELKINGTKVIASNRGWSASKVPKEVLRDYILKGNYAA